MTRLEWLALGIMALGILLPSVLEWVKRDEKEKSLNERSQRFKKFVEKRQATRAYKWTAWWIGVRIWLYRLFHPRRNHE